MSESAELVALRSTGVIAVLRAPSAKQAIKTVDALVAGGVTGIEITYSTPDTAEVIREVALRHGGNVLLGAGTVTTARQAEEAAEAGAEFLVSPGTNPELAKAMLATGASALLGAFTATEVLAAIDLGALAVKIFPASLGGPSYLKALRGPFPDAAMMPTGGVNADNVHTWLAAGAVAVGAGSELCLPSAMAEERWDEIERRAREFSSAWQRANNAS
jgi:2-dehydro-3-deoxyphosphogluconate aldolase/(4S)-4-hydroxy-2-oxoglutarate aldolase